MDTDLKDVFKQYGDVKLAQVRYDKTDRSTGEGEVIFTTVEDAQKAYKELQGALVNGQAITLRFVAGSTGGKRAEETTTTTSVSSAASAPLRVVASTDGHRDVRIGGIVREKPVASGGSRFGTGAGFLGTVLAGNRVSSVVSAPGSIRKHTSTGRTSFRGRGRSFVGGRKEVSKADLDAEMDEYNDGDE
jgi:RNA recognition motif-containing protein